MTNSRALHVGSQAVEPTSTGISGKISVGRIAPRDQLWALLVFAAGTLCLAPGMFWGLPTGKAVEGALRILDGQVPYRDFWTMYAPGQFYAVAGLFWAFGREMIVQAVAVVLIIAASAAVFYLLLRRIGSPRMLASVLAAIFIGMFWTTGPELTSYPPALLLLLLALDRVVRYFQGCGAAQLCWAGLLAGVVTVFKHDVAAYVGAAVVISLFLAWFHAGERRPSTWIAPMPAALRFGACASLIVLPVALWIAWSAGADAWQDLFVFPATTFSKVRNEEYPSLLPPLSLLIDWLRYLMNLQRGRAALEALSPWLLFHLPELVFLGGAGVVICYPRLLDAKSAAIAILWLTCMPFFWMAAQVQRNTHFDSMAVLSFLVIAMVWPRLAAVDRWGRRLQWALAMLICAYGVGLSIQPAMQIFLVAREWPGSRMLDLPGFEGIRLGDREFSYYHPIGTFLREHTDADERIYAGVLRHEAIVINKPIFYAIAQRRSCCRYSELHPGVTDRLGTQQEIIRDIEHHNVRAAIIWKFGWPDTVLDQYWDGFKAVTDDGGATLLNEYIAERFEPIAQYDEYVLMWRKDASKPALTTP